MYVGENVQWEVLDSLISRYLTVHRYGIDFLL